VGYFILPLLLGFIPAMIASSKGRSFLAWYVYGALLFIIAIVHALLLKPDLQHAERKAIEEQGLRKCPHCAEMIKREAKVCRFCGRDVEPETAPLPNAYGQI
jgi:hypothetical protein